MRRIYCSDWKFDGHYHKSGKQTMQVTTTLAQLNLEYTRKRQGLMHYLDQLKQKHQIFQDQDRINKNTGDETTNSMYN